MRLLIFIEKYKFQCYSFLKCAQIRLLDLPISLSHYIVYTICIYLSEARQVYSPRGRHRLNIAKKHVIGIVKLDLLFSTSTPLCKLVHNVRSPPSQYSLRSPGHI